VEEEEEGPKGWPPGGSVFVAAPSCPKTRSAAAGLGLTPA